MSGLSATAGVAVVEIEAPREVLFVIAGAPGPVGPAGPVGPQGVPGDSLAARAYAHDQTTPATVWTITHNTGFDPGGITVVTTDGFIAEDYGVQYLVAGLSLRLTFDNAISGVAYLS